MRRTSILAFCLLALSLPAVAQTRAPVITLNAPPPLSPATCPPNYPSAVLDTSTGKHYACLDADSNGTWHWEELPGGGGGGGGAFSAITTGTNTAAIMTVGTGAALVPTGGGIVRATEYTGAGSISSAVDLSTTETAGVLPLTKGGTNQSVWAGSRCVQTNAGGTAFEVAAGACATSAGTTITVEESDANPQVATSLLTFDIFSGFQVTDAGSQRALVSHTPYVYTGVGSLPSRYYLNEGTSNQSGFEPHTIYIGTTDLSSARTLIATDRSGYIPVNLDLNPAAGCAQYDSQGLLQSTGVACGSGSGGGAPTTAQYLTLAVDGTLTGERTIDPGTGIAGADGGANGAYTLSFAPAEVNDVVWGNNSDSTIRHTWDASGTGNNPYIDLTTSGAGTYAGLQTNANILAPGYRMTGVSGSDGLSCGAGAYWIQADSLAGKIRKCENGTSSDLDTVSGTGVANRVTFWTGPSTMSSDSGILVDTTTDIITAGGFDVPASSSSGGEIELKEDTDLGTSTWKLALGATNLTTNVTCTLDASGKIPAVCLGTGADTTGDSITAAQIMVGQSNGVAAYVTMSGDVTITGQAGGTAISAGVVGRDEIDEALLSVQTHATDCTALTCDAASNGELCLEQDANALYGCDGSGTPAWVNLSAGGGITASSSDTLTNKTLDAEGTGNVLTTVEKVWLPAAGCNNATAAPFWDLPATNPAAAACYNGTNVIKGVLDFDAATDESAQTALFLPSDWTGAIDAKFSWQATATAGDVAWTIATACVADGEDEQGAAFNAATTATDTAKGTTTRLNTITVTGITATGCGVGELMHVLVTRNADDAADTMTGDARLLGVELTLRRAQ